MKLIPLLLTFAMFAVSGWAKYVTLGYQDAKKALEKIKAKQ